MQDYLMKTLRRAYCKELGGSARKKTDNSIHASKLSEFCIREFLLCHKHDVHFNKSKSFGGFATAITYDIGRRIQESARLKLRNENVLIGNWTCLKCNAVHFGNSLSECSDCNGRLLMYDEYNLVLKAGNYVIQGSPDAIIFYSHIEDFILEFKSMTTKQYEELKKPLSSHMYQVMVYLWLVKKLKSLQPERLSKVNTKTGLIAYICKTQVKEPIKIFPIELTDAAEKELDKIYNELKKFSKRNNALIPKTRICKNKFSTLAKSCGALEFCFKEEK